jgi:ubiquinone/menaquinone biosynthesis C-methylase UbiE
MEESIACAAGCRFPILNGIPRFVPREHYATSFGIQWNYYRQVQLDSVSGHSLSRERLTHCLGGHLDMLRDKVVLECGAGAGRFTEVLLDSCGALVVTDVSNAVEANRQNCEHHGQYLLLQADINNSPLPERYFDVVICLGVIQHTPSPEETIANLARHVKLGGWLVIDHYTRRSRLHSVTDRLTLAAPLRAVLRRVARRRPAVALQATRALTAICDPIRRRTSRHRWLDRVVGRLLPSFCYYALYPQLPLEFMRQWHELDTHDGLTDWYKHFRSRDQIEAILRRLGFSEIDCVIGGNGVEARARYVHNEGKAAHERALGTVNRED